MRIRSGLSALVVCSALTATSRPAKASTQQESICDNEPTGEDCDCDGNQDGTSECFCQVVWGLVCNDVTVEVGTMPTPVYRFFNGTHHLFSTTNNPPAGYVSQGVQFHLANDPSWGGVPFTGLWSGQGWMFPDTDSSAVSTVGGLTELFYFWDPAIGDSIYTTNPNDPVVVNHVNHVGCADPPVCDRITLDEYFNGPIHKLVGR